MAKSFRMYRREPIEAGGSYLGTTCNACGGIIYALNSAAKDSREVQMEEGTFAIICPHCLHDDNYLTLKPITAPKAVDGPRPPRATISKSSRKPLDRTYRGVSAIFGVGYIEDRPKAAAIVARIITSWADIEILCANLLAQLMGTNVPAAAAVFSSLRSSRAQSDALEAVANVVLDSPDDELLKAYLARRASLEKERNDLAHGCFGVAPAISDGIIWVSQGDMIAFRVAFDGGDQEQSKANFRKKQFVYELGTLERIAQEIEQFHLQLNGFIGYLKSRHDGEKGLRFRAQRYPQLCNQPHIREALDRARTAKKS
jgi:hypothetical protein